jgi:hypothetical protein
MLTYYYLLFPLTLAVGLSGSRTSYYIRHATGSRGEVLFMQTLCWSPLLVCLIALLLFLTGSNP